MEIKINLDIEDIVEECISDEDNFKNELRQSIVRSVRQQILNEIGSQLVQNLKAEVEADMPELVKEQFGNWLKDWRYNYNGKEIDAKEYLEHIFRNNICYKYGTSINSYIEDFTKNFSKELKQKYDLSFAALIVKNMADQKLLCDDKLVELVKQ